MSEQPKQINELENEAGSEVDAVETDASQEEQLSNPSSEDSNEFVFSDNVTILERDGKTYYIIGTAHISKKSVEEVQDVIEVVRPDTVCVELCETRYTSLTDENVWKKLDVFEVVKQGKTLYLLAHLALSAFQRRMGEQLGVKPGAELMAAVEKAKEVDAQLVLADRDVQITLKRTWRNLSFVDKLTVFSGLFGSMFTKEEISEEELEQIKEKDQLSEMMDEFAKAFPSIKKPLIDERDAFLISSIEEAPGQTIVAVVGAGHVQGMTELFGTQIDREEINVVPPKPVTSGWFKWLVPLLVLIAFYVGISKNADKTIWDMLTMWILPNSIVCAVFTLLAGGKALSAVVGFIASPITSLNPMLGAGMAVGFTEAWLRKPTVEDAERINTDVQSFSGVYKNPFTRVLFVAFLANMGSAFGAYAALAWLWFSNFF